MSADKSTSDAMKNYTKHEKQVKNKRQTALRFMVDLMKKHDLKHYAAEYSGEGDSGAINFTCLSNESLGEVAHCNGYGDNFEATDDEILEKIKDIVLVSTDFPELIRPYHWDRQQDLRKFTLFDALEQCAYFMLPDGFEINDGGQGVMILDAEKGELEIEAGSNYTEVNIDTISYDIGE